MTEELKTIRKRALEDIESATAKAHELIAAAADGAILGLEARLFEIRGRLTPKKSAEEASKKPIEVTFVAPVRHGDIQTWENPGNSTIRIHSRWDLAPGKSNRLFYCVRHGWEEATPLDGCAGCRAENRIIANPDPKRCNNDYHPPECDSYGHDCRQNPTPIEVEKAPELRCKACGAEIYIGNCCGEACTKLWMAEIEQAHRDKSKGRRFCRRCGSAHELKSNLCGSC